MHSMNPNNETFCCIKEFLPLIIISTLIIAMTLGKAFLTQTYTSASIMADFMGFFFIVFGFFKLINLNAFAKSYAMYDLIAQQSIGYAYAYPFIEIALGIAYLMRWNLTAINWITLIIMLINAAGVAIKLSQGALIVCACLGTFFKIPMTYVTLLEDLIMASMAAIMLIMA